MHKLYKIRNTANGLYMNESQSPRRKGGSRKEFSEEGGYFALDELESVVEKYFSKKMPYKGKHMIDSLGNYMYDSNGFSMHHPITMSKAIAKRLFTLEIIEFDIVPSGVKSTALSKLNPDSRTSKKLFQIFTPVDIIKMREWIK